MDTRSKVIPPSQLGDVIARHPGAICIAGPFDPLWDAEISVILATAQPGRPLVVLLTEPRSPLLPAESRAVLLAGLRAVTNVVLPEPDGSAASPSGLPRESLVQDQAAAQARQRQLFHLVSQRHQLKG